MSILRNAYDLRERIKLRVPGYADADVLASLNDAWWACWTDLLSLDSDYFTQQAVVTVSAQSDTFDFLLNLNNALSAAVSNRIFIIDRIRVQQPQSGSWYPAQLRSWNDQEFLALQQQTPATATNNPPYMYVPLGSTSVQFGRPLPANTQMEVTYTLVYLQLNILTAGTVSAGGTTVTGTGTNFTQILGPDFQGALPGVQVNGSLRAEIKVGGQNYAVNAVTSDTALTTFVPVTAAGSAYVLATIPDMPEGHEIIIADIASRNMFSSHADNAPQFAIWNALAEKGLARMKDTAMKRARSNNARIARFPGGWVRRFGYGVQ
jgi:hypothetical protein